MPARRINVLDLFLIAYVLMYYGRLSVVLFIPQYAIDYHIPSIYYSLHFAMVSVGSAISNVLLILMLRKVDNRTIFIIIGLVSATYEVLLYFFPTPGVLLMIGLAHRPGRRMLLDTDVLSHMRDHRRPRHTDDLRHVPV